MISRRHFLHQASMTSLGFIGLNLFACREVATTAKQAIGYGPLLADKENLFSLPEGFSYRVISRWGDPMSDGLITPNRADGMAAFAGEKSKIILVRNHEISTDDLESGALGSSRELLDKIDAASFYDYGKGESPCLGGTTSLIYDEASGEVTQSYMSLAGTIRNCAGGPTPWGSWITCEENTEKIGDGNNERDHGYNFEVPASMEIQRASPIPLKDMGRFNHEAVCVDPRTGIVYETEDRGDGLIYRFLPNEPSQLHKGGKLQALAIKGQHEADTRNWPVLSKGTFPLQEWLEVEWIDLEDVQSPDDDLRDRGAAKGAARFARGEGMWFGENEVYFACTSGGAKGQGQVFRYVPGEYEGTDREAEAPGRLQLFAEPNNSDLLQSCDNLTVAPWGGVFLCEDAENPRILGLTAQGDVFHFGLNTGHPDSELTGVCFSPSGKTMFVNIQHYGLTLAIEGPWDRFQA